MIRPDDLLFIIFFISFANKNPVTRKQGFFYYLAFSVIFFKKIKLLFIFNKLKYIIFIISFH